MSSREFWQSIHPPVENPTLRILSHGGGVQTTTILEMAERGDFDRFDAAIMGDTGNEPAEVYEYLEKMRERIRTPLIVVKRGDLLEHIRRSKSEPDGRQIATLPFFLADGGQMMRTCTKSLKIDAVTLGIRRLLGLRKGQRVPKGVKVEVCIGISTDEKKRAGGFPAEPWQRVRYPLLEADMSFGSCLRYLEERQVPPPPRSRCIVCPFRSDESWRALPASEFELACREDERLRDGGKPRGYGSEPFLHRSRQPLREVDLTRQVEFEELDDCFGVCGT